MTERRDLSTIGHIVAQHGVAASEPLAHGVVRRARTAGLSPLLCSVAADPGAPSSSRERALGRLLVLLDAVEQAPQVALVRPA